MDLLLGFKVILFDPINIGMLILGSLVGALFGMLPGLSVLTALSLLLPLTYSMDITHAILLMIGTYCSGVYGGSLTAILFKIPGDPENTATTFDGYPMTKKGEASKAIGGALGASVVGGLFSAFSLILFAPAIMKISLSFGPCEFFGIIFLSLSMVAVLNAESFLKGGIAVLLGLLIGTVGIAPESGAARLTFGFHDLLGGIEFLPVLLGIFAISEVLIRFRSGEAEKEETALGDTSKLRIDFLSLHKWLEMKWLLIRTSLLGILFGTLPGLGATLGSFFAYNIEKSISKKKDEFGTGIVEGVISPETTNNATTGSGMILLLSLGIPGTVAAAILLEAFQMHGIQTGAFFFVKETTLLNTIFAGFIIANLMLILIAFIEVKTMIRLLNVQFKILGPIIITFCVLGSYSIRNNFLDIVVMFLAGLLGYVMIKYRYPIAVLILGNILGPLFENAISRSLIITQGDYTKIFLNSFISAGSIICGLLLWLLPIVLFFIKKRKGKLATAT